MFVIVDPGSDYVQYDTVDRTSAHDRQTSNIEEFSSVRHRRTRYDLKYYVVCAASVRTIESNRMNHYRMLSTHSFGAQRAHLQ
jgi:hypothetical protein